jgi:hypothetical protein
MSAESFGVTPTSDRAADQEQANYFQDELHRELVVLNQRAEELRSQLAEHMRYNRTQDAAQVQNNLRSLTLTRRSVLDMLSALTNRFVDDTST